MQDITIYMCLQAAYDQQDEEQFLSLLIVQSNDEVSVS